MSNEDIFAEYIKESGLTALNPAWVLWMLNILADMPSTARINPVWLRANTVFFNDDEPPMGIE
jgi:hypothetical protein